MSDVTHFIGKGKISGVAKPPDTCFGTFLIGLSSFSSSPKKGSDMGRSILLWLLGVPIPIIILIALFWH